MLNNMNKELFPTRRFYKKDIVLFRKRKRSKGFLFLLRNRYKICKSLQFIRLSFNFRKQRFYRRLRRVKLPKVELSHRAFDFFLNFDAFGTKRFSLEKLSLSYLLYKHSKSLRRSRLCSLQQVLFNFSSIFRNSALIFNFIQENSLLPYVFKCQFLTLQSYFFIFLFSLLKVDASRFFVVGDRIISAVYLSKCLSLFNLSTFISSHLILHKFIFHLFILSFKLRLLLCRSFHTI